jgi:hypothetical protein
MSNTFLNLRIGIRHLQIGFWFITFRVNTYNIANKPKSFMEIM